MILAQKFAQAVELTKKGKLHQSQQILKKLIQTHGRNFALVINYATTLMQLGQNQNALAYFGRAIKIDPYSYIAYYNRFLCNYSLKKYLNALSDLKAACSCLYANFGYNNDDIKYLNKSIKQCQGNANAYVLRGKLNQNRSKIGLAINDFQRSTYQLPESMSESQVAALYYEKAMFYRRIKKNEDFQQSLSLYFEHKQNENQQNQIMTQFFDLAFYSLNNKQKITLNDALKQIEELVKQFNKEFKSFSQILTKNQNEKSKKQHEQILKHNNVDQNLLQEDEENDMNADMVNMNDVDQMNHTDSIHPSQNDDSKTLQQKIQKLQRQIREKGGKIPDAQDQDQSKDQQFLEFQIQKAVEQLQQVKKTDVKENTNILQNSQNLAASQVKSVGSVNSLGSKLSSTVELTEQQMDEYNNFTIEIVSVKLFKQDSKDSYINLNYGDWKQSTKKTKKQWRQKFNHEIIPQNYQIFIQMFDKGSLWRSDSLAGEGFINIRQKGQTKCVLQSKSIKIGVLYYKLKLLRKYK